MSKIMVVEDDATIRQELTILLQTNGYLVVEESPCDLVLLDVNLPGESGYSICRKIRETSDVPVIFLTARDLPEDELIAFGVGADDFIRKPYNSSVLLARIGRLLKKHSAVIKAKNGLVLNLMELKVQIENKEVELTKNETKILACLMEKELCTKTEIIEKLWNESLYIDENTLYVNIQRLREKLAKISSEPLIRTVRGVGYRL